MPLRSVLLLAVIAIACREPVAPLPCTYEDDTACWTHLGLENEWVISLADTPVGIFAGTRGNGVWRYEGRTSWRNRGLGPVRVTALLFQRDATGPMLFAATAHMSQTVPVKAPVFMSRNGGATWTERDDGVGKRSGFVADGFALASDPGVPGRLYAGLGSAVLRTENSGATWSVVYGDLFNVPPSTNAVTVTRAGGAARVWAGGIWGAAPSVRRSDDNGQSWRTVTRTGFREDFVSALLADDLDRDHLFVGMLYALRETHDGGQTWKPAFFTRHPGSVPALTRTGELIIAVSYERDSTARRDLLGVYLSRNNGSSWDTLPVPPTASAGGSITSNSDGSYLIGTLQGVWRLRLK